MGAPLIPSRNRRQQTHEQTETHPGGAQLGSDVYKRQQVPGFPIVEVSWFDRTDEVRERVAEILRDTVMGEGYPLVQVIFTTLYQERFYEYEQE